MFYVYFSLGTAVLFGNLNTQLTVSNLSNKQYCGVPNSVAI